MDKLQRKKLQNQLKWIEDPVTREILRILLEMEERLQELESQADGTVESFKKFNESLKKVMNALDVVAGKVSNLEKD